jgi:pimeloyl-ACP methyl ester carboxylesterase
LSEGAARSRLNIVTSGTGPAFVFQHGLCGDAGQTAEVFPAEAAFRCITVECRGHGKSEAGEQECFSIGTFADDIVAIIETEALAPVVIGGISMGAAIALRIAVTRPDLIRALVLARPAWIAEAAPANMRLYAEVGDLLSRHSPEEARARFETSATAARLAQEAPDNLASLVSLFSRHPHDMTAELLKRIAADGPGVSRDEIARLRLPTLVIGNTKDEAHPLSHAQTLMNFIPGAALAAVTSKSDSRAAYVADFRAALARFLASLKQ